MERSLNKAKEWKTIPTAKELFEIYPEVEHFIFDMDGTLLDSEVIHMGALQIVMKKQFGIDWEIENVQETFVGVADKNAFKMLSEMSNREVNLEDFLELKKDLCFEAINKVGEKKSLLHPDMNLLLKDLKANDKKLSIVTASEQSFLHAVLNWIDPEIFEFTLSTADTIKTKPEPDPYLLAFEKYGNIPANKVVIFEDSVTGIESARRSGGLLNIARWFDH